jgi:VWFA-related protein
MRETYTAIFQTLMRSTPAFRLALVAATAAALAAIAAVSGPLHGQAGARERTLFVSALDERGEPVEGLGPEAFVVREDGLRREILRVSRAIEPIDIAILADNSAAATSAVGPMRDGLRNFVATMAADNSIALVGLADRPTILVDYTSNQERLRDGIGRLFPMGSSGMTLLEAIVEVSSGLGRRDAPRAAIVAVTTNGVEFTNRYSRDVIAAMTDANVALHAITIGELGMFSTTERERALVLDRGTRETGGRHVTLLTDSAIDAALGKLARELSSQYKIVYGRPESLLPPETTEVTSARPGVTMRGTPARGQTGD